MQNKEERKLALVGHVNNCPRCVAARKRANDFCDTGRLLFFDYVKDEAPISERLLSAEESARIIQKEKARARKANSN